MRLAQLACTRLRSRHVGPIDRNVFPPEIGDDLLQIGGEFLPEGETYNGDVFTEELVVLEAMANPRFPQLKARHRFVARYQPVQRPLRKPDRKSWHEPRI